MTVATTPIFASVTTVAHADWSVEARKRWIAVARRAGDTWRLAAPVPVGDPAALLAGLHDPQGAVLFGIDAPIGLPRAYAEAHGITAAFPEFLRDLAGRPSFFRVCAGLEEVGPWRPFYPLRGRAGMTRASHAAALGLKDAAALHRAVDRATAERPAGAPPLWTLGANQSGKAALAAWHDVLLPALPLGAIRLWPFDGDLPDLLSPGMTVIAETYPAEALRHLGIRLKGSKRRQADRAAVAEALLAAMAVVQAKPDAPLLATARDGFGADAAGEDRFDCVLGVLCVLNVLHGNRPDTAPDDPWIQRWEGWVLGQTALPSRLPDVLPMPTIPT